MRPKAALERPLLSESNIPSGSAGIDTTSDIGIGSNVPLNALSSDSNPKPFVSLGEINHEN